MTLPPLHSDLQRAIALLARSGVPPAEIRRRLLPVASRLRTRQPSYSSVHRYARAARRAHAARDRQLERVLGDLLMGRVPRM